jgi:hypothetical protein
MLVVLPAMIASLIAAGVSAEQEGRRRRALGLGDQDPVNPWDFFVPVAAWPDGASIWKAVLPEAIDLAIRLRLEGDAVFETSEQATEDRQDLDPANYLPGGMFPEAIATNACIYVYLDGGAYPEVSVIFRVNDGDAGDLQVQPQRDVGRVRALRINLFLQQLYQGDDPDVAAEKQIVDDDVEEARLRVDEAWAREPREDRGSRIESIVEELAGFAASWLRSYVKLKDSVRELDEVSGHRIIGPANDGDSFRIVVLADYRTAPAAISAIRVHTVATNAVNVRVHCDDLTIFDHVDND